MIVTHVTHATKFILDNDPGFDRKSWEPKEKIKEIPIRMIITFKHIYGIQEMLKKIMWYSLFVA